MRKKIVTLLVLALALALLAPAFASNIPTSGDTTRDVYAQYEAGSSSAGTVYAVDISWTTIEALKYKDGDATYVWDVENHRYTLASSTSAEWVKPSTSVTITLTNHSNADITASAEYVDVAGDSLTTTATWAPQSVTCERADKNIVDYGTGVGSATTGEIKCTVTVREKDAITSSGKVGSITLSIGPKT